MLTDLLQAGVDMFDSAGTGLMGLALSPFARVEQLAVSNETMSMLNWIFPISECVALLQAWGVSIGSWYVFKYVKKHYQDILGTLTDVGGKFGKKVL